PVFGWPAGVYSVITGEGQILGQVRDALKSAEEEGTAQQSLAKIFRHAIEVGKRSRAETGIGRGAVSLSSAAVALATERLGTLVERRVPLLGAGELGGGMARPLAGPGGAGGVGAGRGAGRAPPPAPRARGRAIPIEQL